MTPGRDSSTAAQGQHNNFVGPQFVGVWIGRRYVALKGPMHKPLFSERNRLGTFVLPLVGGWRGTVRRWQGA